MATRKDKPEETTDETTDETTEAAPEGGRWEYDETTGDNRWIPDEPEPPQ